MVFKNDKKATKAHQIEFHRDILKTAQVKFAKELALAGGEDSVADYSSTFDLFTTNNSNNNHSDLPNIESVPTSSRSSSPKSQSSSLNNIIRNSNCQQNGFEENGFLADNSQQAAGNENLPATRIRRQYNCNDCGFRTINPREFLYHRRDLHGYKVKIVECPYCVYACQYVQKLQRHLLLVHKLNLMHTIADGQFSGASDSMLESNQQQEFLQQELNDQQQRNRKSIKKARIKSSNQKEFDEENENDNNESTLLQ
ncbi:hypothetical protein QR98_0088480 [Sarcoptes scabiei]|uniref:C2H2-type domain-containing protein n=1 Tax=Sarcoptes scabiei TaxID=52283 RepID=A0A132AIA0_SARSC|nr:hypothetical protein QR98_0088480 [Sarcoptes scabiei]